MVVRRWRQNLSVALGNFCRTLSWSRSMDSARRDISPVCWTRSMRANDSCHADDHVRVSRCRSRMSRATRWRPVNAENWSHVANLMRGYWQNQKDTAAAFRNGFFRTGDLGYQDADGYFYILDRLKDMIVTGGENVYCGEVEAVILDHP